MGKPVNRMAFINTLAVVITRASDGDYDNLYADDINPSEIRTAIEYLEAALELR